jgi:hypothetical protein
MGECSPLNRHLSDPKEKAYTVVMSIPISSAPVTFFDSKTAVITRPSIVKSAVPEDKSRMKVR